MASHCRVCGAEVISAMSDENYTISKCSRCHALTGHPAEGAIKELTRVALPRGYEVTIPEVSNGQGFRDAAVVCKPVIVRWSWRAATHPINYFLLLIAAVIWNGASWYTFVVCLIGHAWFGAAFLSIFLMTGGVIGKLAAERLFNRTTIRLDESTLSVRTEPISMGTDCTLEVGQIDQLFVREFGGGEENVYYNLMARRRDGSEFSIVGMLDTALQAIYLESLLERRMRIEDRPIKGEISGKPHTLPK